MTERYLPPATPETRHFWEGARAGRLMLQRCQACRHAYFPPQPFCPQCSSRKVEAFQASGRASLYSYTISLRDMPGMKAPYSIAVVQLEEGPRMMTNIVDCPQTPEALELDMPLEVKFVPLSETLSLPQFAPAKGGQHA